MTQNWPTADRQSQWLGTSVLLDTIAVGQFARCFSLVRVST
ncbi:hypothetical protein [Synechocystis salina]|nr:hypothetical protein [Synechocystis salina]